MMIFFVMGLGGAGLIWILGIRPLVVRHGKGYRTGVNFAVAALVDWQSCGEIADEKNCRRARRLYRSFLGCLLLMGMGMVAGFFSEMRGG